MALDTEFVRERTFYQKLGLVQVAAEDAVWLVDPIAVRDLQPVVDLLSAPSTLKVLHSVSEDIEVFHHTLGAEPRPLFDTQVGAALAGIGPALGYARLVATLLEVELHKGETRTDWLRRPLSEAQLAYAAEDVVHLLPLYRLLRRRLEEQGRLAWALADSAALADTGRFAAAPERAYLRLRGAGRLGRRQLAALRELAAWRESEARRRDVPRRFLLRDDLMLALASRQPKSLRELERLPSYDPRHGSRDAGTWLEILERAAALPDRDLPAEVWRFPDDSRLEKLAERLRESVRAKAAQLGIQPEALVARRSLDVLLRSAVENGRAELPPELDGWRREVIGEELLRQVESAAELGRDPSLRSG